jgi:hypothetical protein
MKFTQKDYANKHYDSSLLLNSFYYALEKLKAQCEAQPPPVDTVEQNVKLRLCFFKMLAPYFDGFGVAITFLEFISQVYGRLAFFPVDESSVRSVVGAMQRHIRDGERKYSMEETADVLEIIQTYIKDVLLPMCDEYIARRIPIQEAAKRSQSIVDGFDGVERGEANGENNIEALKKQFNTVKIVNSLPIKGGKKTRRNKKGRRNTRKH